MEKYLLSPLETISQTRKQKTLKAKHPNCSDSTMIHSIQCLKEEKSCGRFDSMHFSRTDGILCHTYPREEHLMSFSFLGELRNPLTSFTFSQNDMCLVFVAFATWAVRTSDLHAPDAWKTGLEVLGAGGMMSRRPRGYSCLP